MKPFLCALPFAACMLLHSHASTMPLQAEAVSLPPAAQKLQKGYQATMEAVETPIRDRYVEDLAKLRDEAMNAGKVDEAVAIRNEINLTMAQPMLGKWNDTIGSGVMELHGDGAVSNTNGEKGKWNLEGDILCIHWNNGWRIECPLVKPGKTLKGQLIDPAGKIRPLAEERPS